MIQDTSGVSKGFFLAGGGGISTLGVVRAPVAIINFAPNPCKNLWVYTGFNRRSRTNKNVELIIATGARATPNIEIYGKFTPLAKTSLWKPPKHVRPPQATTEICNFSVQSPQSFFESSRVDYFSFHRNSPDGGQSLTLSSSLISEVIGLGPMMNNEI